MEETRKLNWDEKFCYACGAIIKKDAEICPKCGVRQTVQVQTQTTQVVQEKPKPTVGPGQKGVNFTLVLLISIFFGHLGIDRFLLDQVGLGILKLFTLGGLGVWWLVDLILVASKYQFNNIVWL